MGKLASGIPDTLVSQVSGLRIKYKWRYFQKLRTIFYESSWDLLLLRYL